MSFGHRIKWVGVLILLLSWFMCITRSLPLEKAAKQLNFGQTIEEVDIALSGFDRCFTERYPRPQAIATFTSGIRFVDADISVSVKVSYTHRGGYLKYEYLDLYFDSEEKLVGYEYDRSS